MRSDAVDRSAMDMVDRQIIDLSRSTKLNGRTMMLLTTMMIAGSSYLAEPSDVRQSLSSCVTADCVRATDRCVWNVSCKILVC